MRSHRKGTALAAASLAALAVVASACGSDSKGSGATTTAAAGTTAAGGGTNADLSKVCPNPVIVQTDWYPEVDHWELYAASDPATAEIKGDRVISDLIDPRTGKSTGVKLEIRNGGPATQYDLATVSMYKDPAILIGYVNTDESVQFAKDKPTVAVMAPRETSPQIIMWDPATYPDVKTIAGLKEPDVKVRYFKNATYMAYLVGAGVLSESQVDDSYDGKPDAFIAAGGKDAQQGFATAEPFSYEHEIKQWGKPVTFQLVADAGYDYYAESLNVKPESLTKYADCLKGLVPIFQAAQVTMLTSPQKTQDFIVKVVQEQNSGWVYGAELAAYAVKASLDNGIVGNGPDKTLGNLDDAKLQKVIDTVTPIFKAQGGDVNESLKPSDIGSNQFIDTSIGLSG